MLWQRYLRDFLLVAFSVLLLYGSYVWFTKSTSRLPSGSAAMFSDFRKDADLAFQRRVWSVAAANYKKLLENDPYNGYAWYFLGASYWNEYANLRDKLAQEEGSANPDLPKLEMWRAQMPQLLDDAERALRGALESARYRNAARYMLAFVDVARDQHDRAIEKLHAAMDDGFARRGGMEVAELIPLRSHPEFDELRVKEYNNLRKANVLMPPNPRRPLN